MPKLQRKYGQVQIIVEKIDKILHVSRIDFCCDDMYEATVHTRTIHLPHMSFSDSQCCKLENKRISACPYCGEKIEITDRLPVRDF